MIKIKNTSNKQLTFPLIEVSILGNSEKEVTDEQATEMLKNIYIETVKEKTVEKDKKVEEKLTTSFKK